MEETPYHQLVDSNITGLMLYPLSGVDISPLLLYPNVNEFVFIDNQCLLNHDDSKPECSGLITKLDEIIDYDLINKIKKKIIEDKFYPDKKFPLSFSYFMTCTEDGKYNNCINYDFSCVYEMISRYDLLDYNDPYVKLNNRGLIHILQVRLTDHTEFNISSIEIIIPYKVYKINLISKINKDYIKTIFYIKSDLQDFNLPEIKWLKEQNFVFNNLFIKGNPYYTNNNTSNNYTNIKKTIAYLCNNCNEDTFTFITDQKPSYYSIFTPINISPKSVKTSVNFGYDKYYATYGYDVIKLFRYTYLL